MAAENSGWGGPKIQGELLKLGFEISEHAQSPDICATPPTTR
jgi:hypothetical protein